MPRRESRRRDYRSYLFDVLEAIAAVRRHTAGCSYEDYCSEEMRVSATERQLINIGEALSQLSRQFPETASEISNIGDIIGFRHMLVHGYDIVDSRIVWTVIVRDLDPLERDVRELLGD